MTDTEARLDRILADPLAAARAAGRAVGYVGLDIPEDLLAAGGLHACHLPWQPGKDTPKADIWLESSFPPWTRNFLDDWAAGRFDFMEKVVFTRGEDSSQRLYYYVSELRRTGQIGGPEPLIFDIAKIARPTSEERTIHAVRRLAERLGLTDEDLARGIDTANARRDRMSAILASRESHGPLYEKLARASLFAGAAEGFDKPDGVARGRVLLGGTPPPDDRFHRAVEATGWTIAGEGHARSLLRLGPPIAVAGENPAAAIGRHAYGQGIGARAFGDGVARLVAQAQGARADAVILWLIEEEEALVWDVPGQKRALAEAGIPALVLARRSWDREDGAADEMQRFIREIA